MNQHESVVLPVGERVAQMVFYRTGKVEGEYAALTGKYQRGRSEDIERIIRCWRPQDMLPRAYKDERKQLKEV